MPTDTKQEQFWAGAQGKSYLKRNFTHPTRQKERKVFYDMFLPLDRDAHILEVGCNCGINLQILQDMGFTNLSGIDIGEDALNEAKNRLPNANFTLGSILDMPYDDNSYDVVFSSGVLIHQDPTNSLSVVMSEMIRCAKKYILGLEDYNQSFMDVGYRGSTGFYWRGPFLETFLATASNLHKEDEEYMVINPVYKRQCYKIRLS